MSDLPPDLNHPRRSTRFGLVGIIVLGVVLLGVDIALLLYGIGVIQ